MDTETKTGGPAAGRRLDLEAFVKPEGVDLVAHDCSALEQLADLVAHREGLEESIRSCVEHLRSDHRVPWAEIAASMGVTRQAVQKRYRGVS